MSLSTTVNAVRTTGIYCRADCVARPAARNVSRHPSGVAAEAAGFRPCLRCRPDRLPPLAGAGNSVLGRALLLVAEGALDSDTEASLSRRLGVSVRHLRRLFLAHIGASPNFLARSRRAHFARRLLDETDLSMEALSTAAGFGSLRQMNRVVLQVFHFTPKQLRAKRRNADRLVSDGGLQLRMPFRGPLDFEGMLRLMGLGLTPGVESIRGGVYRRTIVACAHAGMIEIERGDESHLRLTAHLPTFRGLIDDVGRCRRMFGLDQPAEAAAVLSADPLLRPLVEAQPGLRLPVGWDPFEAAIRIICGLGASSEDGAALAGRLAATYGEPIEGLGGYGLSVVFPSAERMATASAEEIRTVGVRSEHAQTISRLARACRSGRVILDGSLPLHDCAFQMAEALGIDIETAGHIASAVGYLDAFLDDDVKLRAAAGRMAGRVRNLDPKELAEWADQWRPYRALAATYLWSSDVQSPRKKRISERVGILE